jgi:hypothetical protein
MTAALGNTAQGTPFATGVDAYVYPQFIGYALRAPSAQDIYNPGTEWQDNSQSPPVIYITTGAGLWTTSGTAGVTTINGSNGITVSPTSGSVIVSGINATTSVIGVASFNPLDFTVKSGQVSLVGTTPNSYTNVTFGMSPYSVGISDYFISVDCSGGPVSLIFPDSPPQNRQFIIKDRLGQSATKNITLSAGFSTIDGSGTQIMEDAFESIEMLFHGTNYEIF